jgi:glycosyltransferase involved in cell wall biosynthesis
MHHIHIDSAPARVCFPFVGDTLGGSHLSTLLLIENLDRRRFEPLIAVHLKGPLSQHLRQRNVPYTLVPLTHFVRRPFSARTNLRAVLAAVTVLRRHLVRERVAVLHTNDLRCGATWSFAVPGRGTRFIWHQRSVGFGDSRRRLRLFRRVQRVVCVSEYIRRSLPPALQPRTVVIRNPVADQDSLEGTRARSRATLRTGPPRGDEGAPIVGFFGNFTKQKRPMAFLDAAGQIRQQLGRPCIFAMLGAERDYTFEALRQRGRALGLDDWLRLPGFQYPVEPWIAACDAVLLPGVDEGFNRVLAEAMWVGTPVVAVDSGANSEICQHGLTGLLVPPGDPVAMASAAVQVITNENLAQALSQSGLQWARSNLCAAVHAERVMALYDEVLGFAGPGRDLPHPGA